MDPEEGVNHLRATFTIDRHICSRLDKSNRSNRRHSGHDRRTKERQLNLTGLFVIDWCLRQNPYEPGKRVAPTYTLFRARNESGECS